MEKFWKEQPISVYQECFNILNKQSLIERQTYVNFAVALFEIAKKQMGCEEISLVFYEKDNNSLGYSNDVAKTVNLNLAKFEKQNLYKIVSTIYHELTHIHQGKTDAKKKLGVARPAEFPFVHALGNSRFLSPEVLGINPYIFYYSCQHEKQARDVGSECAIELFEALKKLASTQRTTTGTIRHIERSIMQSKQRMEAEQKDNDFACQQAEMFMKHNPNFVEKALNKIFQEFLIGAQNCHGISKERMGLENKFVLQIGTLVLLGCDDVSKKLILDFATKRFAYKKSIIDTIVTVIDSPYSKVTKQDFYLFFDYARSCNCLTNELLSCLTNWDKKDIGEILTQYVLDNNCGRVNGGNENIL